MDPYDIKVPVYLITGFLDSGKTSFLNFTISQDYFQIDDTTLLIVCEEGEEEYDSELLKKYNTVAEYLDSEEEFTLRTLRGFQKTHEPARVIIDTIRYGVWQSWSRCICRKVGGSCRRS